MHVIISLDDQPDGGVSVKTLAHPVVRGEQARATPATELADFLMKAVEVWQHTQNMDLPQAHQFVQSLVKEPAKHH
jgi:hypothetical protein